MSWKLFPKVHWRHSRAQKIIFLGSRKSILRQKGPFFLFKIINLRPILRAKLIYEPIFMIYAVGIVAQSALEAL